MDLVAVDAAELDRAAVDEEARPGHLDLAEADAADDLLERAGGRAKLAWPFSGQARTAVGLTNDEGDIISAIRTVRAGDGARMDLGIRKATDILRNSRYGEPWMAGGIEVKSKKRTSRRRLARHARTAVGTSSSASTLVRRAIPPVSRHVWMAERDWSAGVFGAQRLRWRALLERSRRLRGRHRSAQDFLPVAGIQQGRDLIQNAKVFFSAKFACLRVAIPDRQIVIAVDAIQRAAPCQLDRSADGDSPGRYPLMKTKAEFGIAKKRNHGIIPQSKKTPKGCNESNIAYLLHLADCVLSSVSWVLIVMLSSP
jgi:hypothetical protein